MKYIITITAEIPEMLEESDREHIAVAMHIATKVAVLDCDSRKAYNISVDIDEAP